MDNTLHKFKFIDLFAGIGGFHLAMHSLGGECVFASEIDKHARQTYEHNFKEINPNLFENGSFNEDMRNISPEVIPNSDVLCAGFPCQPFSIAGYRQGFDDEVDRGNLFFDIVKILKSQKPSVFLLENVKNFKTHDKGRTIKVVYRELEKIGYKVTDKVLNSMDYGNLPQNRERIYIVGFLKQETYDKFTFPDKVNLSLTIEDCLQKDTINNKYYYNNKPLYERIKDDVIKRDTLYQWRRKYTRENKSGVCPTLTANMGTGGHNVPIILDDLGIRKITPQECANFQGFPSSFKFPPLVDSQLYKQLGNSVSIPVIKRIAKNIISALN